MLYNIKNKLITIWSHNLHRMKLRNTGTQELLFTLLKEKSSYNKVLSYSTQTPLADSINTIIKGIDKQINRVLKKLNKKISKTNKVRK